MIISASRRTDIPAFYGEWFFERLREGYVLVRNPFNPFLVSRVELNREKVDCIVFWTKNPQSIFPALNFLEKLDIPYYFLFTVNSYRDTLEKNLPPEDSVIRNFVKLSERVGKTRVVWRYDPVIFTDKMDLTYHYRNFAALADKLKGYTKRCIISFLTLYSKCRRNLKGLSIEEPGPEKKSQLLYELRKKADKRNIQIQVCADEGDYSDYGIESGKCIDDQLIYEISGFKVGARKDPFQRKTCRCVESIDIGAYNTCIHHCIYCYANHDYTTAVKNFEKHDPSSPLLGGCLSGKEKITVRC